MYAMRRMGVVALTLAIAGCGDDSNAPIDGEDAGGDASVEPPVDAGTDTDADQPGAIGDDCEWASQCQDELICDPGESVCAESDSCDEHDECGRGAHCTEEGVCAKSSGNSPCERDDHCAFGDECVAGFCGCRGEVMEAEIRDVNMLIVLDRSGSMWEGTDGEDGPAWEDTKWYIAISAVDRLIAAASHAVNFGLVVFPHSEASDCGRCPNAEGCVAGDVLVDVSSDTGDAIRSELDDTMPDCCTPTGDTLDAFLGYEPLSDPDADNYILLVADGMETCGGNAAEAAAALRAQDPSVRTFVVGFGGAVDPDELSEIAEKGGTARESGTSYFQADDRDELERAFEDIAVAAYSCVHKVEGAALDPEDLSVYADGQSLPRDPEIGWDYDAERNEIRFNGPLCEDLQGGGVEELAYVQSCEVDVE